MVRTRTYNAPAFTRKDDLRLQPKRSSLELTLWPTKDMMVWQPVWVSGDGKYQTEWSKSDHTGPKRMEKVEVTLYADQLPTGDVSQVSKVFWYTYWYQNSIFRVLVTIEPRRSLLTIHYQELFENIRFCNFLEMDGYRFVFLFFCCLCHR